MVTLPNFLFKISTSDLQVPAQYKAEDLDSKIGTATIIVDQAE